MSTSAVLDSLASHGWTFAASVPDKGLAPLLETLTTDGRFIHIPCTREEEGVGLCAGAYLGGRQGVLLMQSSGLGNCVNAFASLIGFFDVPLLLLISIRGDPGEIIAAQFPMGRTTRPLLELCKFEIREPANRSGLFAAISGASRRIAVVATPSRWLELFADQ